MTLNLKGPKKTLNYNFVLVLGCSNNSELPLATLTLLMECGEFRHCFNKKQGTGLLTYDNLSSL